MGQSLENAVEAIVVAEVIHQGEKLIIPEGVTLTQAADLIKRRMKYEEEVISMSESFDVFPWDGAHAFDVVLTRAYGWSPAEATPGFWGPNPPALMGVEVSAGKFKQVPWGQFSLPNVEGFIQTAFGKKDNRFIFSLRAEVKRLSQPIVKKLFDSIREFLKDGSIYKGQAIRMRFKDEVGKTLNLPEPKFMRTDDINEADLIYSREVTKAVETNLFTPIRRVRELKANGIPVKRGVLLGGVYGTGKTMAAKVASKYAVEAGVTFLYVQRADELADAINFARQYQDPACVIFCEDIDRVMDGERDVEMDDILNVIDGIDTKTANIIVVLTTNNLEGIHPAMLRPGRLDAVIDIKAPDAEAIERLLRVYGGDAIDANEDLSRVGELLDGNIPAVIAEVVKRAKLSQLRLNEPGELVTWITASALEDAAETMSGQLHLLFLKSCPKEEKPEFTTALKDLVRDAVDSALGGVNMEDVLNDLQAVKEQVC